MPTETAPPAPTTSTPEAAPSPAPEVAPPTHPDAEGGPASGVEGEKPAKPATDAETSYMRELRKRDGKLTRREVENGKRHEELSARERTVQEHHGRLSAREQAIADREKLLEEDPLGYAVKHKGYREEDLARRFLNGAKPSQQEVEHRREASEKADREKLQKELDELREAVTKPQREAAQRQQIEQLKTGYKAFIEQNAARLPALHSTMGKDAESAFEMVDAIALQLRQNGRGPRDDRDMPRFWNDVAEKCNAHFAKITGVTTPPAGDTATQGSEKTGQPGQEPTATKPAPTLSGKGSAQRASITNEEDLLAEQLENPRASRKRAIDAAKAAAREVASAK